MLSAGPTWVSGADFVIAGVTELSVAVIVDTPRVVEEVIVVEHTGCGMLTFQDAGVHRDLVAKTGSDVDLDFHAFPDLETNLRAQVERIKQHPWIKDVPVHGLIYEVETGRLRELA